MSSRCDICLERDCKHPGSCNCDTCGKRAECPRFLHPTIRITTKCTQSCNHCCFACSPEKTAMMSIDTAKQVAKFLKNNQVPTINLMGGEFFLNPAWYSITKEFLKVVLYVRLVTTGDWVNHEPTKQKLIKLNTEFGKKLHLSLSYDKWHHNKNVKAAAEFLASVGITYNVATEEQTTSKSIVPIGRAQDEYNFYSTFACYCHNPQNMYSFLINEEGSIFKCPFGVWEYAYVEEYVDGGFRARFKEFNKVFYSSFTSSCTACMRSAKRNKSIDEHSRSYV